MAVSPLGKSRPKKEPTPAKRKLRLFIATSLDGFIAGEGGNLDWLLADQDYGFEAFFADIDTIVMGRNTYDAVLDIGQWPYEGIKTYVFCNRPQAQEDGRVTFTSATPRELLERLHKIEGKDIWLIGGGQMVKSFLNDELIDGITLAIHPIILGGGAPLFPEGVVGVSLKLAGGKTYNTGLVSLTYDVVHLDDTGLQA